ncbi:MAG: TSUP family transporter [Actinophytocola sp.]|nr:TSUP family transporter [Actinophytocola sp.]
METLVLFGIAGFLAQLVDGTLGMGYGVTSSTTLLAFGTAPAVAAASVNLAQVGTTFASGASHWKFRNVDWRTVGSLALPGALGAIAGATVVSSLAVGFAQVWVSTLLFLLGLYVLIRFAFLKLGKLITDKRPGAKFLGPLGLVGGFIHSSSGGGWGPVATTTLLSSGRLEPRKVIGSVSAAEFAVTVSASITFFFVLAQQDGMNFLIVGGLLIGGVLAAPIAAWLARHMPPRVLGAGAGGMIVLTNAWLLLRVIDATPVVFVTVYLGLVALWITGITAAVRSVLDEKRVRAAIEADTARTRAGG